MCINNTSIRFISRVGDIVFSDKEILDTAVYVFTSCISFWGITYSEMGALVDRFKLFSFIECNMVYLSSYGIKGIVNNVRDYIKEQGGPIFDDVS